MVTTIQLNEHTLHLLKKLKEEVKAKSYEQAIRKVIMERTRKESMAGYLGKKYGKMSRKEILKGLRDEHDRF